MRPAWCHPADRARATGWLTGRQRTYRRSADPGPAATPLTRSHDPTSDRVDRRPGPHHNPHGLLGPHPHRGRRDDPHAAAAGRRRSRRSRPTAATRSTHVHDGVVRRRRSRRRVPDYRLEVDLRRRRPARRRRPLPLPADPRRAGPAPDRRGPPRAALDGARRPRPHYDGPPGRRPARRSPSGRRTRRGVRRRRRLQLLGRHRATRCARWARPACGSCSSPASATARAYKFEILGPDGVVAAQGRPDGPRHRGAAGDRVASSSTSAYEWGDGEWMARRGRDDPHAGADERLRGAPRLVAARACPTASSPSELVGVRRRTWASRTSSCCRWPSTRSAAPGATRSPATTRRPPGSARPTTSGTWWTRCTRPASA